LVVKISDWFQKTKTVKGKAAQRPSFFHQVVVVTWIYLCIAFMPPGGATLGTFVEHSGQVAGISSPFSAAQNQAHSRRKLYFLACFSEKKLPYQR
jgi:hypothetical protein